MKCRPLFLPVLMLIFQGIAGGTTTIVANTPGQDTTGGNNSDIGNTYGDFVSGTSNTAFLTAAGVNGTIGTPNIDLTWSRSGTATSNWQFHNTPITPATGGALQLDSANVGSTYSITFSPTAGASVVLNSFNFVNDTGTASNVNYNYTINIVDLTTLATVYSTTTVFNPSVQNTVALATVDLGGTQGVAGNALRLDLVRTATVAGVSGSGNDLYIDNLKFDQVPEPSAAVLGLCGSLLLLRRRR